MKSGLKEFEIIDSEQIWLAFSLEYENYLLSSVRDYSYEAARWNAYLNCLSLNAFISWVKEYLDLSETVLFLPNEDESYKLWEFLNGTSIQLGNNRIVIIPTEDSIVEEFCIQQEWIDIPGWEANFYVLIQVNPEEHWLRILGYANHNTIKYKAEYNQITRTYSLLRNNLTVDLNVMWIEGGLLTQKQLASIPLPNISHQQVKTLIGKIDDHLLCSPRLLFNFEDWAAILADGNLRKCLYEQPTAEQIHDQSHITTLTTHTKVNLSHWLQGLFDLPWHTFTELLGTREGNFAYGWRGGEHGEKITAEQTTAIPALIELLHLETNEEKRLKAAECLGTIAPGNVEAIAALIELLNNSKNKWTRWQAALSLGKIGDGNTDAIAALTTILNNHQDDDLRWQAALSLGEIDPHHPKAGIGRCRKIDLGMQLDGHSVALLVYLMPEKENKVAVLLKVLPTGNNIYLPANLELIVLNESEEIFDQATARSADNYIQLEFTYQAGDSFLVKVALANISHTEEFTS